MPNIQPKSIVSTVANKTRQNVPPQKSSSFTTPFLSRNIAGWHSTKDTIEKIITAFFFDMLNSSSRNAMLGWAKDIDEVIPAKNSSKNQMHPKNAPKLIFWNINGIVTNPRLNAPLFAIFAISCGPKKINAAGIIIEDPNITSANSLALAEVMPDRTTSSVFLR